MNWYKKAEILEDVALKGKPKQTNDGFIYLDLPNSVVNGLFAIIDEDGIEKPPYHLKKYNAIGAHISVMKNDELKKLKIKEIGKEYNFNLGELKSTKPKGWDEVEEVYFVQVSAPRT